MRGIKRVEHPSQAREAKRDTAHQEYDRNGGQRPGVTIDDG